MQLQLELVVDNFAGGGGASCGMEEAIGRPVDIAVNHDPEAITMHEVNHPETRHYCESVWDVDPREATGGRPVALAWFSPDCKHFSKAKGGKPVEKKIRGLAWVTLRWAGTVRPRVIMLENVEEFTTWGPLLSVYDSKTKEWVTKPDPRKKGRTFKSFVNALKRLGYAVEWRELRACDYGAPTSRKRLFLVARCDGKAIVWPEPSHGDPKSAAVKSGKLQPWRTAAEIIDWSIACKSIFGREKPLADKTLARIARGIQRYVIDNPNPFIIKVNHSNDEQFRGQPLDEPLQTVTAKNGWGIVAPTLIQMGYGERKGQEPRILDIEKPVGTITAGGNKFAIAQAFITKFRTGATGHAIDEPLHTITSGCGAARPAGAAHALGLVTSHLVKLRGTCADGQPVTEPMPTITAGGMHVGEVRAFLMKYYGTGGAQSLDDPLHTICTKDIFGLVTIRGVDYQIVDIGMRMLEPHELFAAQGFPPEYIIDRGADGKKLSKAAQVARCGNSVSPVIPKALVRANLPEICKDVAYRQAHQLELNIV